MKDFGSSDVSDDMVLGKDENIFCVADAQTAIKRLDAEQKITAILPMTAKADGEAFIMDGFVRRKGGAGDRMKADGVERFRILTRKRKNIEKIIGKLTQKS